MKPTKLFNLIAIAVAFCFASCNMNSKPDNSAALEKNKESMKKVNEMFASGNTTGIENYVADNVVEHSPMPGITATGLQGLKDMISQNHTAYPDMKITVLSMVADGDIVMMHYNMKGTNSGPWGTMPGTGKAIDVNGVDVVRFQDGKGVEHWGYGEDMKMMTQLGLMPDMNKMNPTTATNEPSKMDDKKMDEKK